MERVAGGAAWGSAPPDEFADMYVRHYEAVRRYCCFRLGDAHEAEDVAQETFTRAWGSLPAGLEDCGPWLHTVARNLCTDALRRRSRSQPRADVNPGYVDDGLESVVDRSDHDLVGKALERLKPRHRDALMMRADQGLSYDEIATQTGVSRSTVESVLWRARQSLKREFSALAGAGGNVVALPVVGWLIEQGRRGAKWIGPSNAAVLPAGGGALLAAVGIVAGLAVTTPAPSHPSASVALHAPIVYTDSAPSSRPSLSRTPLVRVPSAVSRPSQSGKSAASPTVSVSDLGLATPAGPRLTVPTVPAGSVVSVLRAAQTGAVRTVDAARSVLRRAGPG